MNMKKSSNYSNDAVRKHEQHYERNSSSPPISIPRPGGTSYQENTPLLSTSSSTLSRSSSPTKRMLDQFIACQPRSSNHWKTDDYLKCGSPMISSAHRSLRLPNLDLREARRQSAIAAANERLYKLTGNDESDLKRSRSKSVGSEKEKLSVSEHSSPLLLGENILKRRTPSGISLMELDDTFDNDVEMPRQELDDAAKDKRYGATEIEVETKTIYTQPSKEKTQESTLTTSQSCTIHDLNPTETKIDTSDYTLLDELKAEFESQSNPPILSLLYGLVNTAIVLPVIMSFGSIIYHDEFFRPYLSVLMKLTTISGAVHQITFSTVSSLPFAGKFIL